MWFARYKLVKKEAKISYIIKNWANRAKPSRHNIDKRNSLEEDPYVYILLAFATQNKIPKTRAVSFTLSLLAESSKAGSSRAESRRVESSKQNLLSGET